MKELKAIQKELKAPKNLYNSFGKYNYRSCESILESVKPLLVEHDCILTLSDEMVEVGGRVYVKATANLMSSEGSHTVSAYAREAEAKKGMDDSQVTGTASSYARKYALSGLFLIDDTKDADTDENTKQRRKSDEDMAADFTKVMIAQLDVENLKAQFSAAWTYFKGDSDRQAEMKAIYDQQTQVLTKAA